MIGFLREGMTLMREERRDPPTSPPRPPPTCQATTAAPDGASAPASSRREASSPTATRSGTSWARAAWASSICARDRQLDEEVALKVLRGEALQGGPHHPRPLQAGDQARPPDHPRNVLRTHDFAEADGLSYISMEYLEGVTLKDLIKSRGALPLGVGLSVAKQMCMGLEAAHEKGVVHRDIKPQNMLILHGDGRPQDHGLRHRPEAVHEGGRPRLGPHLGGDGDGNARLHAPRAGAGPSRRLPLRHLLAGGGALRDLHRQTALHRRHDHEDRHGPHPVAAAPAPQPQPEASRPTWRPSSCAASPRTPTTGPRPWRRSWTSCLDLVTGREAAAWIYQGLRAFRVFTMTRFSSSGVEGALLLVDHLPRGIEEDGVGQGPAPARARRPP